MSDSDLYIDRRLTLKVERCYACGHFWAWETRVGSAKCPVCAQRKLDEAAAEVKQLEHRLNAQKAATTRAGKR